MLSGQNDTLCGGPETTVHRIASPDLIVMDTGSNREPVASPIILTSHVLPVTAAGGPPGAAAVVFAAAGGGAADVVPAVPGFSPLVHATRANAIGTTLDMIRMTNSAGSTPADCDLCA